MTFIQKQARDTEIDAASAVNVNESDKKLEVEGTKEVQQIATANDVSEKKPVENEAIQDEKNCKNKIHIEKPITLEEVTELFDDKLPKRNLKKKPSYVDNKNKEYMISFLDDFKQSYIPLSDVIQDNDILKEMLLDIVILNYEIYLSKYRNKELQAECNSLRQNLHLLQINEMKKNFQKNIQNINLQNINLQKKK